MYTYVHKKCHMSLVIHSLEARKNTYCISYYLDENSSVKKIGSANVDICWKLYCQGKTLKWTFQMPKKEVNKNKQKKKKQ